MFKVYLQYTSKTRGKMKPILFDTVDTIQEAGELIEKTAAQDDMVNTDVFLGYPCMRCRGIFSLDDLSVGRYCNGCIYDMAQEDQEDQLAAQDWEQQ